MMENEKRIVKHVELAKELLIAGEADNAHRAQEVFGKIEDLALIFQYYIFKSLQYEHTERFGEAIALNSEFSRKIISNVIDNIYAYDSEDNAQCNEAREGMGQYKDYANLIKNIK